MDEWESLRLKIKELETNFLRPSSQSAVAPSEPEATDFWKRKYEQERQDWEKTLSAKAREQALLEERYHKDEEGVSLLAQKIQHLEKKLDSERFLWEEKSRARLLESEIENVRKEWEEKAAALLKQNKALEDKLEKAPEQALEDERAQRQLIAEKLKAEQAVQSLQAQILDLKTSNEAVVRGLESEKKSLEEVLLKLETDREQTRNKISQAQEETDSLRRERDQALEKLEARERERLQEFEDLLQGFSHRIKNHVGIMTGTFEESYDASTADPLQRQSAQIFSENSQDLSSLTDEFLEFSRVPAMDVRDLDLNVLVTRAIAGRREIIQAKKIVLEKNFASSLQKIRGDETLIVRAIEEVLSNALDASPDGKTLIISVGLTPPERLVTVSVRDEGSGISPEIAGKIFRPYFTTRKGRRGMGLARVRRCMDLHGGSVRVASAENGGTAADLEFPLPR